MSAERRLYPASEQQTSEVALRSTLREDLYVVLAGFSSDGKRAIVHVYLNPLVSWVWIGGLVFILGTLICLLPSKHERQRQKLTEPVKAGELVKA
jgi:cytochrome c-type biogenesis protein CcmF